MYWILSVWIRYRNACVWNAWLCELLFTSTLDLVLSLINSITFVSCIQNLIAFGRQSRPQMTPAQEDPANFMDTIWEMAYAMREQAAVAYQVMDQLGRWPEASHEGNLNGPGMDRSISNLLNSERRTQPVLEELLTPTRLTSGLRQWRRFSLSWTIRITRKWPLPLICSKQMQNFGGMV